MCDKCLNDGKHVNERPRVIALVGDGAGNVAA